MALVLADRVKETTTTTGTGTVTLAGAATGFQSFAVVGNGNTTYYTIAGQGTAEWEVGIGTYTSAGTTLSRTTVLASSNAGSLVVFSAGTKDVFVTYPAGRSIYADGTTLTATNSSVLPATSGGTGQSSYAVGDLVYASTTTALSKLADVATGNAIISGGVGVAPSYGKIGLTTHVSGTLPTANGGTNLTSFTANGVVYASSTSALATGSGLVFDGTNLGVGVTPTAALGALQVTTGTNGTAAKLGNGSFVQSFNGDGYYSGSASLDSAGVWTARSTGSSTIAATIASGLLFYTNTSLTNGSTFSPTERMRIDSSGNVGIGTTSPSTYANGYAPVLVTGTGVNFATIQARTDGPTGYANGVSYGGSYSTNAINGARIWVGAAGGAGQRGGILFYTKDLDDNTTQPLERIRITSAGGVSFGTTGTAYGTSGQVLTSAGNAPPTWTTATSANTASAIVQRDASGNFTAGTITAALTGNVTGNVSGSSGSTTGNAATATTLQTARTIAITGDLAYTSPSFDGSANVTAAGTLATVNSNVGSFTSANITVNAKGLITAASSGTAGASISNDTSTSTNLYPLFAAATSGTPTTIYTGNANLLYKPSSGELQSTVLVAGNGIVVNSQTVAASYTIPTGSSGMSSGPITIASGQTVTIASGSQWAVL